MPIPRDVVHLAFSTLRVLCGGAKWSASCVGVPSRSPEVPVRLAPGKVCQESERPEASKRVAL
ncbi:MAG TPA: hypothetical protein VII50_06715 [Acidothermaceae bacterium]